MKQERKLLELESNNWLILFFSVCSEKDFSLINSHDATLSREKNKKKVLAWNTFFLPFFIFNNFKTCTNSKE